MNNFIFDFDGSIPEFDIVVQHVTTEGGGGGQTIEIDSELSTTSNNPVKNKVITVELNKKINAASLATVATSGSYNDLTNKPTIPSSFPVDVELDDESTNPVQNAVITNALGNKMDYPGGGVAGYVLQKTAEGAQWASIGTPSQEQIYQAVTAYIAQHPDVLRPISPAVKAALLQIAEKVAYIDEHGEDYYDALDAALNPPAGLVSITAVFEQGGATIYTTDSLDTLKPMLTVTANYDDGTTEEVTSYTLSGTLTEGTSTITVTYEGKTATFTVVVTLYSTQPVIMTENVVWSKTAPNTVSATGFGVTKFYDYIFTQERLESSSLWDATNGYMTANGWSKIIVCTPDWNTYAAGRSWPASANYKHCIGKDGVYTNQFAITSRNAEIGMIFPRYSVSAVNANGCSFSIPLSDIDDCYAYWEPTVVGSITPNGVANGDIIFAGRNTKYFGCYNISEAPTVTSIEVTFTQGDHAVAASDALYTLKPYMDVVATFSDGSVRHPNRGMVALSGTLVSGTTSTITATYEGSTDTFDVVVS